jgi:[ribosomal protein S18]-alanine N-acetyltransferase
MAIVREARPLREARAMNPDVRLHPLQYPEDVDWCSRLMLASEPWVTLRRNYNACRAMLEDQSRERYLVRCDGERAGFLIINMNTGPLTGYIQSIGVSPAMRGRGVGTKVMAAAEERIFRDSPNVFLCVSSFNSGARRLYERLGYEIIGELKNHLIDGHGEILLRKSRGPWKNFRGPKEKAR